MPNSVWQRPEEGKWPSPRRGRQRGGAGARPPAHWRGREPARWPAGWSTRPACCLRRPAANTGGRMAARAITRTPAPSAGRRRQHAGRVLHPIILSLPSSCLVMPLSSKLCFAGVDHARALRSDAAAGKQSFQDKCVTKLELGHEGTARRGTEPLSASGTRPTATKATESRKREKTHPVTPPASLPSGLLEPRAEISTIHKQTPLALVILPRRITG